MIDSRFKQWVIDTDTVVLLCWDLGHVWNQSIYANIRTDTFGAHLLTGSCERGCGVARTRYLSSSWSPESNKNTYEYPKGYSPRGLYREDGFFMDANTAIHPPRDSGANRTGSGGSQASGETARKRAMQTKAESVQSS